MKIVIFGIDYFWPFSVDCPGAPSTVSLDLGEDPGRGHLVSNRPHPRAVSQVLPLGSSGRLYDASAPDMGRIHPGFNCSQLQRR